MVLCEIRFLQEKTVCEVEAGCTVQEAAIKAGLEINAPCGGNGKCGKCLVKADGEVVKACQTIVNHDMEVDTAVVEETNTQILTKGLGRQVPLLPGKLLEDVENPLLAAVDLGSTTVVVYLLDGHSGQQVGVSSMLNPQRKYGADVVSRCSYALENGTHTLSDCIRSGINTLLRELAQKLGRSPEDIVKIVMVGNACMHHLFLGITTETLVIAPYEPKVKDTLSLKAADYGVYIHPFGELCWLPNIGGFVGADTVACMLTADMDHREKMTLLIDIGTNGEMVLGDKEGLVACSTAAGPAFEGAKITCGMRGSDGAIDHVYLEHGEIRYHVIGDGQATGICGSGLLDAVACFLKRGIVDESGRMVKTYHFTRQVFINQKDIRELQLAKAAIAAGICLLCKERGIDVSDVEELLIAGAFGNYLDAGSACAIGMLPGVLKERIISIGNAAGEGAQIALLNIDEYERSNTLAHNVTFVELATKAEFQDVYIDELEFPEQE